MKNSKVHPTAVVSDEAVIGENVSIGAFCIIHDNVEIGDNTTIDSYSEIGIKTKLAFDSKLIIGKNSTIRSHATIYAGSVIGESFTTGHYVTVRENSLIGIGCQIGNRGDVQGDCSIGNYTKMHADVHVGKKSVIGDYVWLFPNVLLTNDPIPPSDTLVGVRIDDFAVLAANVVVLPGVLIGKNSLISVGTIVKNNVAENAVVAGSPARVRCNIETLRMPNDFMQKAYPWRRRFHRGYPNNVVAQWKEEFNE